MLVVNTKERNDQVLTLAWSSENYLLSLGAPHSGQNLEFVGTSAEQEGQKRIPSLGIGASGAATGAGICGAGSGVGGVGTGMSIGGPTGPGRPQYGQNLSPSGTSLPQLGHSLVFCNAAAGGAGAPPPMFGLPQYGQKLRFIGYSRPHPMHLMFCFA